MFHHDGYHLLIGGSDQLQYAQDARQILEEMHTGSINDMPVPEQDHFVYQMYTRTLPYAKNYRRGAEILLAQTSAETNLTEEEAFPVTILCALISLGLILVIIGNFFNISRFSTFLLQATFLGSFYLLEAQIQGSLALIISIAPSLIALLFTARMLIKRKQPAIILTSLLVAAYISIYSEPALINIVFPIFLITAWKFFQSQNQVKSIFKKIIILLLITFCFTPFAIYSLAINIFSNLAPTFSTLMHHHIASPHLFSTFSQVWNIAPVVLGVVSYYDLSAFNAHLSQLIAQSPKLLPSIMFFLICCIGFMGYRRMGNFFSKIFSLIFIVWAMTSFLFTYQNDALRFVRSLQYIIPFLIIGLIGFTYRKKTFSFWTLAGQVSLLAFLIFNIATSYRTMFFIDNHSYTNDPILMRYNERSLIWQNLHSELAFSAKISAPVLISGFKDTIHATVIADNIRLQPHVLGDSMLGFWPIYLLFDNTDFYKYKASFNTRISNIAFENYKKKEHEAWDIEEKKLINLSLQAIIPVSSGFPTEWGNSQDIFTHKIVRFENICDVIYRHQFAISIPNNNISKLQKDSTGLFRILEKSTPILIANDDLIKKQLTITFDGPKEDLALKVGNQFYYATKQKNGFVIFAIIASKDFNNLNLILSRAVKIRNISWINA